MAAALLALLAACNKAPPADTAPVTPAPAASPVPATPAPAPAADTSAAPSDTTPVAAADAPVAARNLAGTIDIADGPAHVIAPDASSRVPQVGEKLYEGDQVVTEANAEIHVQMADGGYIAVRPNTALSIAKYQANGDASDTSAISLIRGSLRSITGWIGKSFPRNYTIRTPDATIGVRGTDHETAYLPEANGDAEAGTYDTVRAGATTLSTAQGQVDVSPDHAAFASRASVAPPRVLTKVPQFFAAPHRNEARLVGMHDRIAASVEQRRTARVQEHAIELRRAPGPIAHPPGAAMQHPGANLPGVARPGAAALPHPGAPATQVHPGLPGALHAPGANLPAHPLAPNAQGALRPGLEQNTPGRAPLGAAGANRPPLANDRLQRGPNGTPLRPGPAGQALQHEGQAGPQNPAARPGAREALTPGTPAAKAAVVPPRVVPPARPVVPPRKDKDKDKDQKRWPSAP